MYRNLILDFDSTLIKLEGLDELAKISFSSRPDKDLLVKKIEEITELGMNGELNFTESIQSRISLINASESDLHKLNLLLINSISDSVLLNSSFFEEFTDRIFIISGGFKQFIDPIGLKLGLNLDNIFANDFVIEDEEIKGIDINNPLAFSGGKSKVLDTLNLDGKTLVVGDGYTDYLMVKSGFADSFVAFTENVHRHNAVINADHVVDSFDLVVELLNW